MSAGASTRCCFGELSLCTYETPHAQCHRHYANHHEYSTDEGGGFARHQLGEAEAARNDREARANVSQKRPLVGKTRSLDRQIVS